MSSFPFYKQLNAMDCGPTCLRMIAKHYGKFYNTSTLREMAGFSKAGVSLLGISDTAEKIGFRTRGVKITLSQLNNMPLPCVLHWDQQHFVVLTNLNYKNNKGSATIADPSKGMLKLTITDFKQHWISTKNTEEVEVGLALLLEPTPEFYLQEAEKEKKLSWSLVLQYFRSVKTQLLQVILALCITMLMQFVFPFLTQSMVDGGINGRNLNFITIILAAQVMLSFSQMAIGFLHSRLMLKVSNILNIQILSDFWIKLTKLPVSYFDVHHTGDTLQRIGDHGTIQNFLTGKALSTIFSIINFIIYALLLIVYNVKLFTVFCIGSIIYFLWIQLFLRIRRKLNYESFHLSAKENNAKLQLIQGMQEIRLHNAEKQKRWEWENIQASLFKLNLRSLNYGQIQQLGAALINQLKGIFISYFVAKLVVSGELTFGTMLAVQYIIGQLSGPVNEWVGLVQSYQDAKISMERLNEIHSLENEEDDEKNYLQKLPSHKNITLKDVSFSYPGIGNDPVLKNITVDIPENKVTAIVGASGSGKTTLIKILLKIYDQYNGDIRIGASQSNETNINGTKLNFISHKYWRSVVGAVMQEGYVFNDNIAKNIAVGEDEVDYDKLTASCHIANIQDFIDSLPNGYFTKLGADGTGISQGQKQRMLIARAVYKNPEYIFLDEATNALDANNEKAIVENLQNFYKGKTVVVVAHRLSTVKNADKIIVLDNGCIVEEGQHEDLINLKGKYFTLVKNQLELGS